MVRHYDSKRRLWASVQHEEKGNSGLLSEQAIKVLQHNRTVYRSDALEKVRARFH
jgi:hypothetical protein